MRMLSLFIGVPSDGRDPIHARVVELLLADAFAQHRVPGLDVLGAVRGVDARAELEVPVLGGREDPGELLHLRVRDPQHRGERPVLVRSGRDLRLRPATRRRAEHLDVAEDDARDVRPVRAADAERGDEVDLVAGLERADEALMLVAGNLDCALDAGQLGLDPPLRRRREAARRDLLARVDRLRGDELGDLVGIRDRARHDAAAHDLTLPEHLLLLDLCTGRAGRDVALRDPDRHVRLVLADVPLIIRHVEARQQGRDDGQRDGNGDVFDPVRHERLFSFLFLGCYSTSWTERTPKSSDPLPDSERIPSQMTRTKWPSTVALLPFAVKPATRKPTQPITRYSKLAPLLRTAS